MSSGSLLVRAMALLAGSPALLSSRVGAGNGCVGEFNSLFKSSITKIETTEQVRPAHVLPGICCRPIDLPTPYYSQGKRPNLKQQALFQALASQCWT